MNKVKATKIAFFSSLLLVISPFITLITNDFQPDFAVGQYILLFSGLFGLIASSIELIYRRKRES